MPTFLEREIIGMTARKLQSDGYEVLVEPDPASLPEELRNFRIDAVAFKEGESLIVEVATQAFKQKEELVALSQAVERLDNWKLKIVLGEEFKDAVNNVAVSVDAIGEKLTQALKLREDGAHIPAYLLLWSIFEAMARILSPEVFARPQGASGLIEKLAGLGYLTPTQADSLRSDAALRNQAVHGGLDVEISEQAYSNIVDVLRDLTGQIKDEFIEDANALEIPLTEAGKNTDENSDGERGGEG